MASDEDVTVGLEVDRKSQRAVFRVDGKPTFSVTLGQLNRLLSQTCIYVVGRTEKA